MKVLSIELYQADTINGEKKFLGGVDCNLNALLPAWHQNLLVPALLAAAAQALKVKRSGEFDANPPPPAAALTEAKETT